MKVTPLDSELESHALQKDECSPDTANIIETLTSIEQNLPSYWKIIKLLPVQLDLISSMVANGSLDLPVYFLATVLK